jgi:phage-related protein
VATPNLTLEDTNGNIYIFPLSLFLVNDPFSVRSNIKQLIYAHGGRNTGDGFINSRKIMIEGHLRKDTAILFESAYRDLVNAVLKGGKLKISSDTVSRYIEVSNPNIEQDWEHYPNYKNISISFDVQFPFWQDDAETIITNILSGNSTFAVDGTGSDSIVMPIIEIHADQSVDVPTFTLTNLSDNGMNFVYTDSSFLADDILVIDCKEGTIKRNSNSSIDKFVSGAFLRLQPRSNTIIYAGAACTVLFKFRKIYL